MKEELYTYFKVEFKDCASVDYNYTICASFGEVKDYLESVEIDLDDPERKASVTITGIGMTEKQYDNWIGKNLIP